VEHAVDVGHDVAVGEAEDLEALHLQVARAAGVVVLLGGVGVAVDLDGEHRGAAGEIDDVAVDHGLLAELDGFEAPGAEVVPEAAFGGGGVGAHFPGAAE
jgi:hypothetical protein